jgi:hypothetical protein
VVDVADVIDRLVDDRRWPTYRNSHELSKLESLAHEAYDRSTFDGYLSYVLITHQVSEDYVLILLKHAQFTLSISLALHGFSWRFPSMQVGDKLEGQMFGKLLELLENSIEFGGKERLIQVCREMNQTRNRLAHHLVAGLTLQELASLANEYQEKHNELVDLFNDADGEFSCFYFVVVHDGGWDRLIRQKLNSASNASNESERQRWEYVSERLREGRVQSPIRRIGAWEF